MANQIRSIAAVVSGGLVALSPARPLVHALVTAAVIVGISVSVAGMKGLPHGWQTVGLLFQALLMAAVATLTWHTRAGRPFIPARPTIPRDDHH